MSFRPNTPVRAVFAGSPLHGTSLAAPDKLQHAMSLFSNIGTFAEKTHDARRRRQSVSLGRGQADRGDRVRRRARSPRPRWSTLDRAGPRTVRPVERWSNNHEINWLRLGRWPWIRSTTRHVELRDRQIRGGGSGATSGRIVCRDLAADIVFPGDNDMVVDTGSMTDFGGFPRLKLSGPSCDFRDVGPSVWHCNYFRQQQTISFIAAKFN